ncbi:MAG TPA: TonB-dependent receptor [Candidatus Sulfotelmatobacter sp.]|nr:TonB-dependent receptor [Candidatus Sulfotelmatobacter sp.]
MEPLNRLAGEKAGRDGRVLSCQCVACARHSWLIVTILLVFLLPAGAQEKSADLTDRSLEDLMNMEVTSVSKKEQKLSRTASAIFVITQEDIRRSGATNIPDLLRMVPGMDVGQINGSTWAISSRGFNSQFSNKLLVMIDRRIVYTATFAGVFWDTIDFPLEDIERIEVIRGPGGAIWGANAVNGVISIFTKKASETCGGLVESGGGNIQQGFGLAQYGAALNPDTDYRFYSKYFNQYHMEDPFGQNGADGWHTLRSGFRIDSEVSPNDTLMFEGDLSIGREGEFGFKLPSITSPGFIAVAEEIHNTDGSFVSVWNHTISTRSSTSLQLSYDRHTRDDPLNPEIRDTLDLDFQHQFEWGSRQEMIWGLGYRDTPDQIKGSLTVEMIPVRRTLQVFNAFVQDEFALIPNELYLTLGSKFEHNDYTGFEIMPDARVAWAPAPRHMLWAAVSRDLRAPSRNDTNLVLNLGTGPAGPPTLLRLLGNPSYKDERLMAYEFGYRTTFSDRFSLDLAAYFNDYDGLQTTEPGTPFPEASPPPAHIVQPFMYENLMYGETHGLEIAANWKAANRWTISPGYAFEQLHMHTDPTSQDTQTAIFIEGAAPRQSAQLRSHLALPAGIAWDASAYFVGRLIHQGPLSNVAIPAYTRVDTGLTWKIREGFSFSVFGQNLAKDHHFEFEDINGALQNGQIKRSAYAQFRWQF